MTKLITPSFLVSILNTINFNIYTHKEKKHMQYPNKFNEFQPLTKLLTKNYIANYNHNYNFSQYNSYILYIDIQNVNMHYIKQLFLVT